MSLSASLASSSGRYSPARPGQLGFGLGAGLDIDEVRQPMEEAADHRDMPGAELAVALRGGGRRQHRLQRFAVQRAALTQIGSLMDTA